MGSEWSIVPLAELAADEQGAIAIGPFGSRMKSEVYVADGVPVIRGLNITGSRWLKDDWVYVTDEFADGIPNCVVQPGDLVFPHRGAIGEVALIEQQHSRMVLSTSMMKFHPDPAIADSMFLYYYFRSIQGRSEILRFSSQVGTPGIGQPLTSLRQFRVPHPPLPAQQTIASILGSLDDRIESNRRMNQVLEQMIRAIIKAWFIDFEPVKAKAAGVTSFPGMPQSVFDQLRDKLSETDLGLVPSDWPVRSIAEIADYVNGRAFTKYANGQGRMIIRIAELNSGPGGATKYSDIETEPEYIAFPDDILFAWSGSLDVYRWHRDEAIINQHIFKVISKDYPKWYVYYRLVEAMPFFQSIASTKATTMGHIKRGHLSDAVFAEPPMWMIEAAEEQIRPLYDLIHCNARQSFALANTRDVLLPKLISGQLRLEGGE